MSGKVIVRHQLLSNLARKFIRYAAIDVYLRQFIQFGFRGVVKRRSFGREVRLLGVILGTDGDILTGSH